MKRTCEYHTELAVEAETVTIGPRRYLELRCPRADCGRSRGLRLIRRTT